MNNRTFFYIATFFLIYLLNSYAMQNPSSAAEFTIPSIIKTIPLVRDPWVIMSTMPSCIEVVDEKNYNKINYHDKYSTSKTIDYECFFDEKGIRKIPKNICVHPAENKVFFINNMNSGLYCNYENRTYKRFDGACSSGVFSDQESVLYIMRQKDLLRYNYKTYDTDFLSLKKELGILFSCPSEQQPYFLCSDLSEKKMYKIELLEKKVSIKKLFNFPFPVDLAHWVYMPEKQLFFCVNKESRLLHIFNIKGIQNRKSIRRLKSLQKEKYWYDMGQSVAAMGLHPNKDILVLLPEKRNTIEYIYISSYHVMNSMRTTFHEFLSGELCSWKKITFCFDGKALLLGNNKKECYMIKFPEEILEALSVAKTMIMVLNIFQKLKIPSDIRKLISYLLLNVLKKEKA